MPILCRMLGHTVKHPIRVIEDVNVTWLGDTVVAYNVLKDHYLCARCGIVITPSKQGPLIITGGGQ